MNTIGIIGFGNMGAAVASNLKKDYRVFAFDKDATKLKNISRACRVKFLKDLLTKVNVVILAVKPQDLGGVLAEVAGLSGKQLFISIVAGIPTDYIEKCLGKVKVVRVMPNMPVLVGRGATALTRGKFASVKDVESAKKIFSLLGEVVVVGKEELIDTVTALSGSGPAYFFYIFSALASAAVELGLDKKSADLLLCQTIIGAVELLKQNKFDAQGLITKVASRGGTTEAALKVFEDKGLGKILREAIICAYKRAGELSKK